MNVLGLSGSPRKDRLTDKLLQSALDGAGSRGAAVEKIVLNDLSFRGCQDCGGCDKTGLCVIQDDMQAVYKKVAAADALVVASPIFFGSVSSQLKTMIDRNQSAWVAKHMLKKALRGDKRKGLFLSVGGMETDKYFQNAKAIIKPFFATLNIEYSGELFFAGYNLKADDEAKKEAAIEKAFQLGASLVV